MTENFEPNLEGPVKVGGDYDPEAPQPGAPTEEELAADTNLYPPDVDLGEDETIVGDATDQE